MNEFTFNRSDGFFRDYLKNGWLKKWMLLITLFGALSMNAQTSSPWFEGFSATTWPTGWQQTNFSIGGTIANINYANPTAASGNYVYKNIYGSGTTATGGFVTPSIGPILEGDKLQFIYKIVNWDSDEQTTSPGAGTGDFKVMISNDAGATYTTVSTILNGDIVNWTDYEFDLDDYVGDSINIKIQANLIDTDVDYYLALDNFLIDSGTCDLPSIPSQTANTLTSVDLTFTGEDSSYQIQYGAVNFLLGSGTISTESINNVLQITGLTNSSEYGYYVRRVCDDTESPWVGPFKMFTACGIVNSVFENFNSTPTGNSSNHTKPLCWFFVDEGAGYGYVTTGSAGSAPNHFYMYNAADVAGQYILVGPETDNLGNGTKQLRFLARASNATTELIVGTMNSQSDEGIFSPLQTIPLTSSYQEFVISLPAGTNDYFAFKHATTATYQSIYIDDVYYETPPVCAGVNFGSGTVSNITDVQATLAWTSTATNFDIEWGINGFVQGSGTLVPNVTNNYVLNGLTQSTDYSFYVRSSCGEDGVSVWRGPYNFTTQTVVPSPWYEGFATSTAPEGFATTGFSLSSTIAALAPADSFYYYRNIWTVGTSGGNVRTINVGPILTGDKFSFDYRFAPYSGGGILESDAGDLVVEISTDFGETYTNLATLTSNDTEGWQNFETSLASYVGETLKFRLTGNWNEEVDADFYLGFDGLYVGSCDLPTDSQITSTTISTAVLGIAGLPTDSYVIEYGLAGFEIGTGTTVTFTGNSFTIDNLLEATAYEYTIKRSCTTSFSPTLGKYRFVTSCSVFPGAFSQNFDDTPTGSSTNETVPICWSFLDGGVGYGFVSTGSSATLASSPNHFNMFNGADLENPYILVSPETVNLGDGYYRVRFKARSSSAGTILNFGTMTNKLNAETFTSVQMIPLTSTYAEYIVYLPIGTNDYFAFKHGLNATSRNIYIDDVFYESIPDCVPPVNLNADKNLLTLTANLTWSGPEVITDNNFEIEWGLSDFEQGTGTIVTSTSYSTLISNLILGEGYSYYVRRICEDENSTWVGPFTFEMGYCVSLPTNNDGTGIGNVTITGVSMDSLEDVTYEDFTDYEISFNAGELVPASITFNTGFTYDTNIWIDFNNDGIFDNATELFFSGQSLNDNPTIFDVSFTVPYSDTNVTGDYRMRIGTADSGQSIPNSCYSGSYGVTVDLLVNVTFPCDVPTDINFPDVGFDYAVIDWTGQGNSNYELEYGLTGFAQGQGTVIENVTKPYTLEGLTSGATYDFYIRKICAAVTTDWSEVTTQYIYCDTPEPTGDANQTLVEDELLSDLVIDGENIKYYADPSLTIELPATTALLTSGTYFVTQTIGCESDSSLIVNVTILPRIDEPGVNPTQDFCDGGSLSDIVVSSLPSATVIWYQTLTSTEALSLNTPLVTGTYYVVQTDDVTTSHRVEVNVTVNPTPPNLVPQPIHLCGNFTFGDLTINSLPGAEVKWYTSMTAVTPIANNVSVETGTYYVTQKFGICESQRVAYQVAQFEALATPVAAIQTFCGSGTVADLTATGVDGAQMLWYSSANSINALAPTTNLVTGTYYVVQTINGCYSERKAVAVRVASVAAPEVSAFTVCGSGYVSDLHITAASGVTFKWFNSPSSTTELAQTEVLSTGTYFVSRVQYGCESARASVSVTVASIPSAPTGNSIQSFAAGATVSDLITNQGSVVWYITYNDALDGVNPLVVNMPLVNGTTYYGVIIGSNGCPSLPLAVTVEVVLSNNDFVKDELKYYPNPVVDLFNISYSERIKQIEVFDILGKRVKTIKSDNTDVQVDLSDLSSGTYMVQLRTETKSQFIKVVKK